MLLRQTEAGAKLLEEDRRRFVADGNYYRLSGPGGIMGVCNVLQGNIGKGIHIIEAAILRREEEGYLDQADWMRMFLCEVYLQIIAGKEKLPLPSLPKNLPIIVKVMFTASSRIPVLMTHVLKNPHLDPSGHHVGRVQMILGLLYKTKKRPALALQHLTEAKRIIAQFGQTPMLARIDAALVELG